MQLTLENIGMIRKADIHLDGVTVIAGENNTGKSTVGKALFSVLNCFSQIDERIKNEKIDAIQTLIKSYTIGHEILDEAYFWEMMSAENLAEFIVENIPANSPDINEIEISNLTKEFIKKILGNESAFFPNEEQFVKKALSILNFSAADYADRILEKELRAAFHNQICNIHDKAQAKILLRKNGHSISIILSDDKISEISKDLVPKSEAIYIDTPFALDEIIDSAGFPVREKFNYKNHLVSKLNIENRNIILETFTKTKLEKVLNQLKQIGVGDIINVGKNKRFKLPNSDQLLDIRNLSAGLKTFVILKTLLLKGAITESGTIILDEPEIHLHPEWQLIFAELIVLIQKEFSLHILLTTHSPYFLNALEVYTIKHGIHDKCRYYLASKEGESAVIEEVTNDIDRIYAKLARPFQELENERYRDGE